MKPKHLLFLFSFILFFSCDKQKEKPHLIFHTSKLERKKNAPFSDAVTVGNTIYLAGQVGINPETKKLPKGGIKAENNSSPRKYKSCFRTSWF